MIWYATAGVGQVEGATKVFWYAKLLCASQNESYVFSQSI